MIFNLGGKVLLKPTLLGMTFVLSEALNQSLKQQKNDTFSLSQPSLECHVLFEWSLKVKTGKPEKKSFKDNKLVLKSF